MTTMKAEVMNILGVLCAVLEYFSKESSVSGRLFSGRLKTKAEMGISNSRETMSAEVALKITRVNRHG